MQHIASNIHRHFVKFGSLVLDISLRIRHSHSVDIEKIPFMRSGGEIIMRNNYACVIQNKSIDNSSNYQRVARVILTDIHHACFIHAQV